MKDYTAYSPDKVLYAVVINRVLYKYVRPVTRYRHSDIVSVGKAIMRSHAEARMARAYYYSFEPTGDDAIDAILEAVARAGKGCHHTDGWNTKDDAGQSYVEKIQNAANEAAKGKP